MIKMLLELICRIPDHIGWMLVGAVGAYASVAGWKEALSGGRGHQYP